MRKAKGAVGAVVACLLSLPGCENLLRKGGATGVTEVGLPAALSFAALLKDGHVSYAVSVQQTSVSLQDLLRRLSLPVTVTEEPAGVVRLRSSTPSGEHFSLLLYPDGPSSKTRVTLEWETGNASQQGVQFLLDLELKQPSRGAGAP